MRVGFWVVHGGLFFFSQLWYQFIRLYGFVRLQINTENCLSKKKVTPIKVRIHDQYRLMGDLFFLEKELNVLSRKRLASCISHIKPCAVGTSSGVKYGCQLHRNMQMWAYTVEGREGGRWRWFISRVFQLVLVERQSLRFPSATLLSSYFLFSFLLYITVLLMFAPFYRHLLWQTSTHNVFISKLIHQSSNFWSHLDTITFAKQHLKVDSSPSGKHKNAQQRKPPLLLQLNLITLEKGMLSRSCCLCQVLPCIIQVILLKGLEQSKSFCFYNALLFYCKLSNADCFWLKKAFVSLITEAAVQPSTRDWELQHWQNQ